MAGHASSIHVEIRIHGSIERVWELTQTPELHQRWDLRFTEIEYLPRTNEGEPQKFLYGTRIGFGLQIHGYGETTGSRNGPGGERTSALKFWSDDAKSLIQEGSGYWKYVPVNLDGETVRFLTEYDYRVRFGAVGRLFDRSIFRPLIGWGTAWSFDRLRLWIEKGIDPAISMRQSLVYLMARVSLSLVWLYQGLVPKLSLRHSDELAMLSSSGMSDSGAQTMCVMFGCVEVAIGVLMLVFWRACWPLWLTLVAMPAALLAVAIQTPVYLGAAFNPVTLNLSVFALAVIGLLSKKDLPSAAHCSRRPPRSEQ
jgi:hypothetical protein